MNHLRFVLIYYVLSTESLCVVNSLQSSKTPQIEFYSVLKAAREGPSGSFGCLAKLGGRFGCTFVVFSLFRTWGKGGGV